MSIISDQISEILDIAGDCGLKYEYLPYRIINDCVPILGSSDRGQYSPVNFELLDKALSEFERVNTLFVLECQNPSHEFEIETRKLFSYQPTRVLDFKLILKIGPDQYGYRPENLFNEAVYYIFFPYQEVIPEVCLTIGSYVCPIEELNTRHGLQLS